jgi:hypothetical protein
MLLLKLPAWGALHKEHIAEANYLLGAGKSFALTGL